MKFKIILILALISSLIHAQVITNHQMEVTNEVEDLLQLDSSLSEKAQGLGLAKNLDNEPVNKALVNMLNDETTGGRVTNDFAIESPWIEALHILVQRFEEAHIGANMDYLYTEKDKSRFLKWWFENHDKIKYQDNGHVIVFESKKSAYGAENNDAPQTSYLDNQDAETDSSSENNEEISISEIKSETSDSLSSPIDIVRTSSLWWIIPLVLVVTGIIVWVLWLSIIKPK